MKSIVSTKIMFPSYMKISIIVILLLQFVSFFTFFMFVPFLSTYFNQGVGFSLGFVGFILAIRILSQQGLMIVGGALADRLGYKKITVLGFFLRGIGFASMGLTTNGFLVIIAAILSGLGGALFSPALKANLTSLTPENKHKEIFSLMNIIENAGTVLGPLAGLYFSIDDFKILSILSGLLFLILCIVAIFLPKVSKQLNTKTWTQEFVEIIKDKSFVGLTVSLIPFHFMYQQLYLTLPIISDKVTGSSGWVFTFVTLVIIIFQWPVLLMIKDKKIHSLFYFSYITILVFIIPITFGHNVTSLLLVLTGIAIGSITLLPLFQSYIAYNSPKESLAAYFGFSNLAMAIGGSLGNLIGGMIYDYFVQIGQPEKFWIVIGILNLLPILILFKRRTNLNKSLQPKEE
jgi:MFS transporter, DHA1 family, multidrug resistance protein